MKKAIIVAHGAGEPSFSIDKIVKTITRAGEALSFQKAKEYMTTSNAWPEYASTSFGDFAPLSDADCTALFGKIPTGNGIVSTGLKRGGDMAGPVIYALRGKVMDKDGLVEFIHDQEFTSVVLLACRAE